MPPPIDLETDPHRSALTVFVMVAAVALPAAVALYSVAHPTRLVATSPNPTPFGYTWSLLLFLVPAAVLGAWFSRHPEYRLPRRAFWRTVVTLTPLGVILDLLFGSVFLTFGNPAATLQWNVPAFRGQIPIEEYVFYLSGFIVILLTYIWADEYWMAAYNVADYQTEAAGIPNLVTFHGASIVAGVVLLTAAILYKSLFTEGGFPGYFAFLIVTSFVPSCGFFRVARPFINWRAFSFTMFSVLLVSLLWETTLALPYQWWGYNQDFMIGLSIDAWSGLPIEAVCVWVAATYTTVVTYEVIKIWQASGRRLREAMTGHRVVESPKP